MRIAYYSPFPPERSGIADYSALLLPALEAKLDVTVVARKTRRRPRGVDLRLYHVGNNADSHGWIVDELRRAPGVVVLHEFVLHHLVAGLTLGRGDRSGYLDAMQAESGLVGRSLAHAVIDGLIPPLGGPASGVSACRSSSRARLGLDRPFAFGGARSEARAIRGPDLADPHARLVRSARLTGDAAARRRAGDRLPRPPQPSQADP